MPSIPLLCSLKEQQQKVCIMLSRFRLAMTSGDGGLSEENLQQKSFLRKF